MYISNLNSQISNLKFSVFLSVLRVSVLFFAIAIKELLGAFSVLHVSVLFFAIAKKK